MGINEWTQECVKENDPYNKLYGLDPGDYWVMYNQAEETLYFKNVKTGKIKARKIKFDTDVAALISHLCISGRIEQELLEMLERKETKGTGDFAEHHIIPVHLWEKSQLIIKGQELTRKGLINIDMNGPENLMMLRKNIHRSFHGFKSGYSEMIIERLRDEWNQLCNSGKENDPDEIRDTILALISAIRDDLEELQEEGITIRQWFGEQLFNMFKKPKSK